MRMMKTLRIGLALLLVVCLPLGLFCSCGDFDTAAAKEHISGFFEKVSEENYTAARDYLHPTRRAEAKLGQYFNTLSQREGLYFKQGVTLQRYTATEIALYTSDIDGTSYKNTIQALIGSKEAVINIEIVQNEAGYGIYNLRIEAKNK